MPITGPIDTTQPRAVLRVKKLDPKALPPLQKTPGSAGFDVHARLDEPVVLPPRARVLIKTGIAVAVPEGYEVQVRPRSGLALHEGVTVLNSPGTIDADYRGEVGVILINHSLKFDAVINDGDRIAQLVVQRVPRVELELVEELEDTERGAGGFGSTGKK